MNSNKYIIKKIISGDRLYLAKAITLIESTNKKHRKKSKSIINQLISKKRKSLRIGISGIPGVGKSTFIEEFGIMLLSKGYKIAILAIDPSSKVSGGSIMADKTRMNKLASHSNVFIRPSPSSGELGGVAKMTKEIIVLCESAGYNVIIIETVGVGQSEISVESMIDFFLVLILFGAGDEFQGIKKGLIEMANAIAINKSDGKNIIKAKQAQNIYQSSINFSSTKINAIWTTPVITCSSLKKTGLRQIWKNILLHRKKRYKSGNFFNNRNDQSVDWMWTNVKKYIEEYLLKNKKNIKKIRKIVNNVKCGKITSTLGTEKIIYLMGL